MRPNNNTDFVKAIQDIFLIALRRQGFSVLLLLGACFVLGYLVWQYTEEQRRDMRETKQTLQKVQERLSACEEARHEVLQKLNEYRWKAQALEEKVADLEASSRRRR